jgi:hypothetical protein
MKEIEKERRTASIYEVVLILFIIVLTAILVGSII